MNTPRRLATPALLLAALATTSCATIAGTVGESFTTALVGGQEVPGPADPQATGTAKVTADSATDTVCADVRTQRLAPATAAHIHKGARGAAGAPVLTLDTPTEGRSNKCYSVDKALAAAILADPAGYYVNIHTAQFPKGAIRGQLR